jgi:hypothetical protein
VATVEEIVHVELTEHPDVIGLTDWCAIPLPTSAASS